MPGTVTAWEKPVQTAWVPSPSPRGPSWSQGLGKRLSSTFLFSILLEAPKNSFKGDA